VAASRRYPIGAVMTQRSRRRRIIVDISPALSSDLAACTQALDRDGIDLASQLHELAAGLRLACLGMTITISGDGNTITFSAGDVAATSPFAVSPLMPLSAPSSVEPGSLSVRFAPVNGFIDLAVYPRDPAGIDTAALSPENRAVALTAWSGFASVVQRCGAINQAIGVLIGRGRTPESAHEDLARLAEFGRTDVYHAAEYLLRDVADHQPALVGQ
jgi:hypothetical protein